MIIVGVIWLRESQYWQFYLSIRIKNRMIVDIDEEFDITNSISPDHIEQKLFYTGAALRECTLSAAVNVSVNQLVVNNIIHCLKI